MKGNAPYKVIERGATVISHYPFPDETVPFERTTIKEGKYEGHVFTGGIVLQLGFGTIAEIF